MKEYPKLTLNELLEDGAKIYDEQQKKYILPNGSLYALPLGCRKYVFIGKIDINNITENSTYYQYRRNFFCS